MLQVSANLDSVNYPCLWTDELTHVFSNPLEGLLCLVSDLFEPERAIVVAIMILVLRLPHVCNDIGQYKTHELGWRFGHTSALRIPECVCALNFTVQVFANTFNWLTVFKWSKKFFLVALTHPCVGECHSSGRWASTVDTHSGCKLQLERKYLLKWPVNKKRFVFRESGDPDCQQECFETSHARSNVWLDKKKRRSNWNFYLWWQESPTLSFVLLRVPPPPQTEMKQHLVYAVKTMRVCVCVSACVRACVRVLQKEIFLILTSHSSNFLCIVEPQGEISIKGVAEISEWNPNLDVGCDNGVRVKHHPCDCSKCDDNPSEYFAETCKEKSNEANSTNLSVF